MGSAGIWLWRRGPSDTIYGLRPREGTLCDAFSSESGRRSWRLPLLSRLSRVASGAQRPGEGATRGQGGAILVTR